MAAGLGFKTFTTGEVLTAADTNGYLMQGVLVFASSAARSAAITSPQEGQYSYLKDTNSTEYYDGAAWIAAPIGDITGVTAGTGISGGGTSGTVTITNSMATEITAKGDLIVGTGAATFDNLAAGANGETLVADSSTSTGLRWQGSMAAGRNFIINGGFDIWQRGTSVAAQQVGFNYVSDRWGGSCNTSGAATVSRQVTGDTTNLPFVQYCARYQRTAGNTATGVQYLNQPIETINSIPLAGKTVTVSFYARAGANFSASGNVLSATLISGTGTDQNYLGTWTGAATIASTNATLTTTWQRFQFTGTVGATATELTLPFTYTPTGTAGANDYYEVTGVQLEVGSIATQFTRAGGTIQGELAACQRYYTRWNATSVNTYVAAGNAYSTTTGAPLISFPVEMRVAPTSLDTSGVFLTDDATNYSGGTTTLAAASTKNANIRYVHGSATLTALRFYYLSLTATSGYLGLSAEL